MDQAISAYATGVREKRPSFTKALVFFSVLIGLAVLLGLFVISQRSETGPLVASETPDPISVKALTVEIGECFALSETFTGLATPRRTSLLGFERGGRVQRVLVDTGTRVKAG